MSGELRNKPPLGRVLGIIAEYDPFHNGHLYHLETAKRITGAELAVCVMSGEFTQRGNPAWYSKYLRAEAATCNGADLVIALPFVYACNNAEYFARGAVDILDGLGCVDAVAFGSESGDITPLLRAADVLAENSEELNARIKDGMARGWSYPKARSSAVAAAIGSGAAQILANPNDILGVEYLRRLKERGSALEPVAVRRFACGDNEVSASDFVAGGAVLRSMLAEGADISPYIPRETAEVIARYANDGVRPVCSDALLPFLLYAVSVRYRGELAEIFSATEGLENRLADAAREASSLADLVRRVKTKRYTETRIRRLIAHTIMGLTKNAMAEAEAGGLYARVLAFSDGGAALLRHIKKSGCARLPLITNPTKQRDELAGCEAVTRFDRRAADVYRLLSAGIMAGFDDRKMAPARKG
ncbi:MAG: nucleotidyltransferase family protein [Clostridiales Family XIII bacterium]|jgi:predicted nucleotidyltransferase|nr:nucleotidyltransferase family protein [Clostridiales Family XIII bacterium]